jgi:hypothetical protein
VAALTALLGLQRHQAASTVSFVVIVTDCSSITTSAARFVVASISDAVKRNLHLPAQQNGGNNACFG